MCTVIAEFRINNYAVLRLDKDILFRKYSKYLIDGVEFHIVPIYDLTRCIAIESDKSFLNKEVKFIE
ncbi:hypothetical protein [Clostridium manihotivorum]|uniref:Uncharacterized protein n=1 Tax=Clostridium manihotivorum TaxID=2320868 RepID=A0A3R5X413_9CLOT|nr:hypothetical protein [Clostridium manihotivorum]QAA34014.1 hypothetical protein C1I91_21635 [Clostridium manihotivorum]